MSKIRGFLIPTVFFLLYFVVFFILRGQIPTPEAFVSDIQSLYIKYGLILVFLAAFFEGMFLVGLYIPGSSIVLLGAAFSRQGAVAFSSVLLLATTGLLISYCLNYAMGRYGWYRILQTVGIGEGISKASEKIKRYGIKTLLIGYFFPGSGSFVSTACGVLKIPFVKFFTMSIIAQIFWSGFWGSIAYIFGMVFVELFIKYFTFVIIGGIIVWLAVARLRKT